MNIEQLSERIEQLEKKIMLLEPAETTKTTKKAKKDKKDKDDSPKKKRVSGYLLFNSAHRDEAKTELEAKTNEGEKIKTTEVTKKLAEMWGAIGDDGKAEWNAKAAEMKAAEE